MAKEDINKQLEINLLTILEQVQQRELGLEVGKNFIMNLFKRYEK